MCTVVVRAHAQGTPPPAVTHGSMPIASPGMPARSDLVTVVPFHPDTGPEHYPWILLPAELDGHRGTFSLDTGSPLLFFNADYLRARSTGGFDTVTTADTQPRQQEVFVTVHTVHIGTLIQPLEPTVTNPPPSQKSFPNAIMHRFSRNGLLGNLGWPGLEPFETIIDYVHHRVMFIRLDKAGRRLTPVPAYTPLGTVRLSPIDPFSGVLPGYWGIVVRHGTRIETLVLDTGAPISNISEGDLQRAADQLKQLAAAHHTAGDIPDGAITVPSDTTHDGLDLLGAQFLSRLGVVGFNLRTHQFIVYR